MIAPIDETPVVQLIGNTQAALVYTENIVVHT